MAIRHDSSLVRFGVRVSRAYLEMAGNHDYDYQTNGESWLVNQVAMTNPDCIFDVGANVGDWTATVRAASPRAIVHAFELVPTTADGLRARFQQDGSVNVSAAGLLDTPGVVKVKYYPGFTAASGINDFPHPLDHEWIEAPVIRGDDYCAEAGVKHIDLLKVDAEGSDHRVLASFGEMFVNGHIDTVQFEYGRAAIRNRFLLSDFYSFFEARNMTVGKLYPHGVDFRKYDIFRDEDFLGPNMIAVRNERADLIRLYSCKS